MKSDGRESVAGSPIYYHWKLFIAPHQPATDLSAAFAGLFAPSIALATPSMDGNSAQAGQKSLQAAGKWCVLRAAPADFTKS